jgi:3'5'-cyclic nucleotide phosphodiesterase
MKYDHSPNNSLIDQDIQLTEIAKPFKFLSNSQAVVEKQDNRKFYLRYYLLLIISFSNNIVYYSIHTKASTILMVTIGILVLLVGYSLVCMFCCNYQDPFKMHNFFSTSILLVLTGACLVIIDTSLIDLVLGSRCFSYLSSLQTLILLSSLGYKYIWYFKLVKFPILILSLGTISLVINLLARKDTEKVVFEFLVLICFILSGAVYANVFKKIKSEKVHLEIPLNSGVEEITNGIDQILVAIEDINQNPEKNTSLPEIIERLKQINNSLRTSRNIYSARINTVTKGLDEEDKIFIEQACFESYNASNLSNSDHIQISKVKEVNYGVSELMGVLENIGNDWNFNTLFISDCSGGTPIQVIGNYAIKRYGLDEIFEIPDSILTSFLQDLENKYEKNPYHNSIHAADVMCSMTYLIQISKLSGYISQLELLASIIASLAHDVGYPGKNNRFLVMSRDDIAIVYNDISVLEMMHCSILFKILKDNKKNILFSFTVDKWISIRKDIIDMILATDMGKHFELLGHFKAKYLSVESHDMTDGEIRNDLCKLIIKAADIGHAAKNTQLHEIWCGLVVQEFFDQGDMEKSLGIPISMYCDRENTDTPKSQVGFIKNIVYPLYYSLNFVLSSQDIEESCLAQLDVNQKFWETQTKLLAGKSTLTKNSETKKNTSSFQRSSIEFSLPEKY